MPSASLLSTLGWLLLGHRDVCVHMKHQILHKFRIDWNFIIPTVMVLKSVLWWSQGPSLVSMTETEKALKVTALSVSLFVRWPTSLSTGPLLSVILKVMASLNSNWVFAAWIISLQWWKWISVVLPCHLPFLLVSIQFMFPSNLFRKILAQIRKSSPFAWHLKFWNLFLCS